MILDNVIEKVSSMCCADVGKTADASTTKPEQATEDVMEDEAKDEVETKARKGVVTERVSNVSSDDFTGKETKFELTQWGDLPSDASSAAEILGYKEEMWNNDEHSDAAHKHWDDLSEEERGAAETLGWDKGAWEKKYEDFSFADVPEHVKRAAESLGFDEAMWNEDRWPEASEKSWNDLTVADQSAYAVIGYCKKSWDH
eukprot:CAMPEP_0119015450 /NCGR_PEP_ID=MMETSP1176-20130426/11042_1 /TAXON_ID=265551 /ORGANISM="Synedropsis recta cf, Strain CCMP1620" /LENGTH=199 /DNA_ID=CAMNT_0006968745 /DNA_START=93 /DNA_END=692 /DNA_ORIENTATION=-